MLVRSVFRSDLSGIGVAAHPAQLEDLDVFVETRSAILAHVPEHERDVLSWCLTQPSGTLLALLALLAVLVADAVDLVHEKGAPSDRRRHALADTLADALDLDMREFWQADASYWTRLPKAELLAALAESPGLIDKSHKSREAAMTAHAKLKKDELAARLDQAFAGTGYLPDLLVSPVPQGVIELTTAGATAIAAEWAASGQYEKGLPARLAAPFFCRLWAGGRPANANCALLRRPVQVRSVEAPGGSGEKPRDIMRMT
jgi:hypothetical protein